MILYNLKYSSVITCMSTKWKNIVLMFRISCPTDLRNLWLIGIQASFIKHFSFLIKIFSSYVLESFQTSCFIFLIKIV